MSNRGRLVPCSAPRAPPLASPSLSEENTASSGWSPLVWLRVTGEAPILASGRHEPAAALPGRDAGASPRQRSADDAADACCDSIRCCNHAASIMARDGPTACAGTCTHTKPESAPPLPQLPKPESAPPLAQLPAGPAGAAAAGQWGTAVAVVCQCQGSIDGTSSAIAAPSEDAPVYVGHDAAARASAGTAPEGQSS